tara:strand:- start:137 stop:259 length:123 start_codon:yes stop_codon:yes gene_type:complete
MKNNHDTMAAASLLWFHIDEKYQEYDFYFQTPPSQKTVID